MELIRKCVCIQLCVYLTFVPLAAQEKTYATLYLKTGVVVKGIIKEVNSDNVQFKQILDDGSHLTQMVPLIIIYKLISPSGELILHNQDLKSDFEENFTLQNSVEQIVHHELPPVETSYEDDFIKLNAKNKLEYEREKLVVNSAGNGENPNSRYWKSLQGTNEIMETYFFLVSGNKEASDFALEHNYSSTTHAKTGKLIMSAGMLLYLFGIAKFVVDSFENQGEEKEESFLLPKIGALMFIGGGLIWFNSKITKKPRWATYSYAVRTANNYNAELMAELLEQQTN